MAREERYLAMEPDERNGDSRDGQSSACFCDDGEIHRIFLYVLIGVTLDIPRLAEGLRKTRI
jgi:uncharacterized protein involved in tellurium resistance